MGSRETFRHQVPTVYWLCRRLREHGGEGFDAKVLYGRDGLTANYSHDKLTAFGLVRVSSRNSRLNHRIETDWNLEVEVQHMYYRKPLDSYTVQIEDTALLLDPQPLCWKTYPRQGSGGVSRITAECLLFEAYYEDEEQLAMDTFVPADLEQSYRNFATWNHDDAEDAPDRVEYYSEVLDRWGLSDNVDAPNIKLPTLLLPWPICYLIPRNAWDTILLRTSWGITPICHWPLEDSVVVQNKGRMMISYGNNDGQWEKNDLDLVDQEFLFHPDKVHEISSCIRQCTRELRANGLSEPSNVGNLLQVPDFWKESMWDVANTSNALTSESVQACQRQHPRLH